MPTTANKSTTFPRFPQGLPLISLIPGKEPGVFRVRLNLPFESKVIGEIRENGLDGTYAKRVDPERHVHQNSGSIAVSASLLHAEDIRIRWIVCDLGGEKFVTTRRFILAHGKCHRYRNYEPQYFLPMELWGKELALAWEKDVDRHKRVRSEQARQTSLFPDAA